MPKSAQDLTRALKLKAEPRTEALTLRIGTKKHVLPFEVRLLSSNEYIFVHIPPSAAILKVTKNGLSLVEKSEEAATAAASFRTRKKRSSRSGAGVGLPEELASALKKIPQGYKLAYDGDGKPKLVRKRNRIRKAS